jgi:hypothetical protein
MSRTPYIELSALNLENHLINGGMDISQRYVQSAFTFNNTGEVYQNVLDRFAFTASGSTSKNMSVEQSGDFPTLAQANYVFSASNLFQCNTGVTFADVADLVIPYIYRIEGWDYAKLHGKTVTLGFWVKSSLAGVYPVSLLSNDLSQSYVTTFTINNPNTWEFHSVTINLQGTSNLSNYSFDEGVFGMQISIGATGGSSYQTSTINQWVTGQVYCTPTSQSVMANDSQTILVTGVKLNLGPTPAPFSLMGKNLGQELSFCQRYYEKSYDLGVAPASGTSNGFNGAIGASDASYACSSVNFKVSKAFSPTVGVYSQSGTPGKVTALGGADAGGSVVVGGTGQNGFANLSGTFGAGELYYYEWACESEL